MRADTFTFKADDRKELFVHRWLPDEGTRVRGVIHIAHGMAEHGGRYARAASELTAAGYAVYANDHRGHGKTAKSDDELGFMGRPNGFARAVRDLSELVAHEKKEHPSLPVFLFGHSMGSYMIQRFMIQEGRAIRGAVLSGSSGKPDALASAGKVVAKLERLRLGERGKSKLLTNLSFGGWNRQFSPTRTEYDWLSSDPAEVDRYIDDPRCGFPVSTELWVELLRELEEIARPENQARVPKDLPVYIFSGSRDPVGGNRKSVEQLVSAYRAAGIKDITLRFYPDGRHESLNEVNRDEVTRDLIAWLDRVLKA
jgi:alpha-beta hydrolase superfamily lysophospholipase